MVFRRLNVEEFAVIVILSVGFEPKKEREWEHDFLSNGERNVPLHAI